jgi:hypothetical protein
MFSRRRSGGWAIFLGVFTILGVLRGIAAPSMSTLVLTMTFFGTPFAFAAWMAIRRRPALVIDGHGLIDGRSRRVVSWDTVTTVELDTARGIFGESHHLILKLAESGLPVRRRFIATNATNPSEVDIDLDWLAIPWSEAVSLVEQSFGRRVIAKRDRF